MSGASPLLAPSVSTIDGVLERLDDIQHHLEATAPRGKLDGVASFNYLYRLITAEVRDSADDHFFVDGAFIRELDVAFGNRYLDALRADATQPGSAPRVWQTLIDDRSSKHVSPIRFAMAGVNAHINFDLSFALLNACRTMQEELDDADNFDTYTKINDIFEQKMEPLREHFETRLQRTIDDLLRPLADGLSNFSVIVTRRAAWENAKWMWPHRDDAAFLHDHGAQMDLAAAGLSETILLHV